jgi:uncharacterized Rmd1/YagE family protein
MPDTNPDEVQAPPQTATVTAHAVLLADRLTVDRSNQPGVVSSAPYCYKLGAGYVVIFRYGAAVLVGLPDAQEKAVIAQLLAEVSVSAPLDEERLTIALRPDEEEGFTDTGRLQLKELTQAHVLVLADILAKSVALARYEREIAQVFDTIEPAAHTLAASGRIPRTRGVLLKLIGSALLAQHRVSGRIAFAEKPDALWDHPELERFYARLEDEYEIVERGTLLNGKVGVIAAAAQTFTDLTDTARSARLELLIVVLILAELIIAAVTLFHH